MTELRLRRADLSWRELDGEIVALDSGNSVYLSTNSSGTLVWHRLAAGTTRDQLVSELAATFEIPAEQAAADVDSFVDALRTQGLLE